MQERELRLTGGTTAGTVTLPETPTIVRLWPAAEEATVLVTWMIRLVAVDEVLGVADTTATTPSAIVVVPKLDTRHTTCPVPGLQLIDFPAAVAAGPIFAVT